MAKSTVVLELLRAVQQLRRPLKVGVRRYAIPGFCVLACVIHRIYGTHGGTLKSQNSMKITTTIDIPEETILQAKYILLAHRNASEHRLLSSFYRGCLLALVDQCADGKLIQWPVEFVIQDRSDAHSWYAIAEKELNEK